MAKWRVGDGCERYINMLYGIEKETDKIIGRAIYPGAKIVTDQIAKNIKSIPVNNSSYKEYYSGGKKVNGLTQFQRAGLIEGLGIAKMQNNFGYVNVKVGEDGYNSTITNEYRKGQPNAMIARALESGTSFRNKNPVFSKGVATTRARAEMAMAIELEKQIALKMK